MSAEAWATSRYTGLFRAFDRIRAEPHDPAIEMYAATLGLRGPQQSPLIVGGAGWDVEDARLACLGEALERFECWLRPADDRVVTSHAAWPLDEPALAPDAFVLFSEEQYASGDLPFEPFDRHCETAWVAFREIASGEPVWVPDAFASLYPGPGEGHGITPKISTGLAAGPLEHPVVLRGLQEVLERDALVRAWWGEYALEEIDPEDAFQRLGEAARDAARRPHLTYRFFRVATPFAAHATLVTTMGEEREGAVFSTGSACRETRDASLNKALLEALQGRHYVRHQRARASGTDIDAQPADFAQHVLHYTLRPERLEATVFARTPLPEDPDERRRVEPLARLLERLPHPPLFRLLTPPSVSHHAPGLVVVRVIAPGLVPLHADHRFAHLDVPFWRTRPLSEWDAHPPHPFA